MSIADKIRTVLSIKDQIRAAISSKGVIINNSTLFSDYPSKIQSIQTVDLTVGGIGYTVTGTSVVPYKLIYPTTAAVIQSNALVGITGIKEVVLQNGTTTLSLNAFSNYSSLEKITLPSTLTSVSNSVFSFSGLKEIVFTSNANLNNSANFANNCNSLEKIDITTCLSTTTIPQFFASDAPKLKDVRIPLSVKTINPSAFVNSVLLTSFDFSEITYLGDSAFKNSGLISANLPKLTTAISSSLQGTKVKSIVAPKIASIGTNAFSNNLLCKYIDIGNTVSTISSSAMTTLPVLESIVIRATIPPIVDNDSFPSSGTYKIYVPDSAVATYKSTFAWLTYASRIYPLSQFVIPVL